MGAVFIIITVPFEAPKSAIFIHFFKGAVLTLSEYDSRDDESRRPPDVELVNGSNEAAVDVTSVDSVWNHGIQGEVVRGLDALLY